ncbi:MAG TPA: hypothetical protein VMC61_07885, partial [Methanocella sp.]|nr:hypothetical protein [Methanocella sp.]
MISAQAPTSFVANADLKATPGTASAPLASPAYYVATNGSDLNPGTYTEPFATLTAARDAIRASGQDGVTVYLRGGSYNLTNTFELTSADSGAPGLSNVYRSYPNEHAIISGGVQLTGTWQKYNATLYSMDVGSLRFDSLFVNDTRAIRAREPDVGYYHIASVGPDNLVAFTFSGTDLNASWNDLKNVEVVSYRRWEQSRFKIDSIVGQKVYFNGSLKSGRGYDWDFD